MEKRSDAACQSDGAESRGTFKHGIDHRKMFYSADEKTSDKKEHEIAHDQGDGIVDGGSLNGPVGSGDLIIAAKRMLHGKEQNR